MFFAWFFVVSPSIFAGIDSKKQTITHATNNKRLKVIICFGLIIGGFFQLLFSYYLLQRFGLNYLNIGILLYASTAITSVLVAIYSEQRHPKIHKYLVEYYFLTNPVSLLLIGLSTGNLLLQVASVIIPTTYFIGILHLHKKYKTKNALMEKWAFATMSVWTVLVTFL